MPKMLDDETYKALGAKLPEPVKWPEGMFIKPDSSQEWELEQRCFAAANDSALPEAARTLIKDLWREVCARAPTNEPASPEYNGGDTPPI